MKMRELICASITIVSQIVELELPQPVPVLPVPDVLPCGIPSASASLRAQPSCPDSCAKGQLMRQAALS